MIIKVIQLKLILVVLIVGVTSCNQNNNNNENSANNTYYISSSLGNDHNNGTSPETPWKTLDKINSTKLKPGQKVLFKSGDTWSGQLILNDNGTKNSIIVIDKYDKGSKPKINGWGEELYTLHLKNVEYITVRNLEITNQGDVRCPSRVGVLVKAINIGERHGITLDSLEIHHVNGSLVKAKGGGSAILWENGGDSIKSRFIDLVIKNNYLHHTSRNGIISKGYSLRNQWYPSLGVIIRNNLLEQIPGDGIVPIATDGAIIEYNIMRNSPDVLSHEEAAAGIWCWSSDNTLIQFNEVSGHKAKWDGQGFDSDYNCKNTIIQYNYSHDNYGGFLLICNDGESLGSGYNHGTINSIIRFNISINDGVRPYPTEREGWFSPIMHITGPVNNIKIHDNLFVSNNKDDNIDKTIIDMDNWGQAYPINTVIKNNVFYSTKALDFSFREDVNTQFYDNVISKSINSESYKKYANKNMISLKPILIDSLQNEFKTNVISKPIIKKWLDYFKE
jgi:hypothetical protein